MEKIGVFPCSSQTAIDLLRRGTPGESTKQTGLLGLSAGCRQVPSLSLIVSSQSVLPVDLGSWDVASGATPHIIRVHEQTKDAARLDFPSSSYLQKPPISCSTGPLQSSCALSSI